MWSELYNPDNKPTMENIENFVSSNLWNEFCLFLEHTYTVLPKLEYSKCPMQKGWNIKYKKGGKSLCTLYPMDGFFIVLVVIGEKELAESELLIPTCSIYTQNLFSKTASSSCGRWLMMEVKDPTIMEDAQKLIQIRVKPRK